MKKKVSSSKCNTLL